MLIQELKEMLQETFTGIFKFLNASLRSFQKHQPKIMYHF